MATKKQSGLLCLNIVLLASAWCCSASAGRASPDFITLALLLSAAAIITILLSRNRTQVTETCGIAGRHRVNSRRANSDDHSSSSRSACRRRKPDQTGRLIHISCIGIDVRRSNPDVANFMPVTDIQSMLCLLDRHLEICFSSHLRF